MNDIILLARTVGYMDRIVREAIEIQLCTDNCSRDTEFTLELILEPSHKHPDKEGPTSNNGRKE